MGDFAEGLKKLFQKDALYQRTYLTKRARYILTEMIEETLSNTFNIESETQYNQLMKAMHFLRGKLDSTIKCKLPMDLEIASYLHHWVHSNRFYHLAEENDCDRAMQWVCNLWCRKYSISDFTLK